MNAAELALTSPASQAFRVQLAMAAIRNCNYLDAAEHLIAASRDELKNTAEWAERAAELAHWCACQERGQQRKALLAALLDLFGKRHGAGHVDINAAAFLASVHIDRGHSAAKALAEGRRLLLNAVLVNTERPVCGAASSGR